MRTLRALWCTFKHLWCAIVHYDRGWGTLDCKTDVGYWSCQVCGCKYITREGKRIHGTKNA